MYTRGLCPYFGRMLTKIYIGGHISVTLPNIKFQEDVLFGPGDAAGLHTMDGQTIIGRSMVSDGMKLCTEGLAL